MHTPTAFSEAARKAAEAGDYTAAMRLEMSGASHCGGHGRRARHHSRAVDYAYLARAQGQDWALTGSTAQDRAAYLA